MKITASEISAICDWLDRRLEAEGPDGMQAWFGAREIDGDAAIREAARYAEACIHSLGEAHSLTELFASAFTIGFQAGIDAERRRRDVQGLPS